VLERTIASIGVDRDETLEGVAVGDNRVR